MKQNIIIRVDGGVYTGMGHITRCIAIAEILKKKFNVIFAIQNPDKHIIQTIRPVTKAIIALPKTKNFNTDQVNFVRHLNNDDIVILDGYNFKTGYQKAIKNKGCKLVCIDDLHAWHHVADVIINHAEGINENK